MGGGGVSIQRFFCILLILVGLYLLWDNWLPARPPYAVLSGDTQNASSVDQVTSRPADEIHNTTSHYAGISEPFSQQCRNINGAENIMVLLKSGATELYEKLPVHMLTTFTCVPNFMIFSDLAQKFGDIPIHDAIAPVSAAFRDHHPDFELYRKLQKYHSEGQDMGHLKGDSGWNLDKWKFLPMLHQAFETAPDHIDWFVVIEADTSLAWGNLLAWLKTMDPKKPFYLGAQNIIGSTTFAHGGSGFAISRGAADKLENARARKGKQAFDEQWEEALSTSCCGDEVIARTLMEADVPLTCAWPIIQGETVATLDFTDAHWCRVAITWHLVTPIEIDTMWHFQANWVASHGWDEPFTHRDIFTHFVEPHIGVNRSAWDNLSQNRKLVSQALATGDDEDFFKLEEYEQRAVESQEHCFDACMKREQCVQWMHSPGRCYLGDVVRFGKSDERTEEQWTSGWVAERIEKFKEGLKDCEVEWKAVGA